VPSDFDDMNPPVAHPAASSAANDTTTARSTIVQRGLAVLSLSRNETIYPRILFGRLYSKSTVATPRPISAIGHKDGPPVRGNALQGADNGGTGSSHRRAYRT
jgi:hypothetical protein